MATCQSCRKQFPEEAKHCPHCGTAQLQVSAEQAKRTVFGYAPSPAELQQLAHGVAAFSVPPPGQPVGGVTTAPMSSASSPGAVGPADAPARGRPGQLDVMAKTMFANDGADPTPGSARVRSTGASPVTAPPVTAPPVTASLVTDPPVREAPVPLVGENIAAPATPVSGPGMLSAADAVARSAVTVTDTQETLGIASPPGEIKWGGVFKVLNPGSYTPVSGRTLGLFVGEVPADQEHMIQTMVLKEVNSALGACQVPLGEIDPQGELLLGVNEQLAPKLRSLGVTGKVTEIKLAIDHPMPSSTDAMGVSPTIASAGRGVPGDLTMTKGVEGKAEADGADISEFVGMSLKKKVILIVAGAAFVALILGVIFMLRS